MPLKPPISEYERILLYGGMGSGKTTSWLDIAKVFQLTNTPGIFYVLDTDSTTARMIQSSYSHLTNIIVESAYDWPEYRQHTANFYKKAQPNDWIVVDQISSSWPSVQRYFTEQVFHQDMGDYFLKARQALAGGDKSLKAFQGWTDWSVINALYLDWLQPLTLRPRCNLIATAIADPVNSDTDEKSSKQLFGGFGFKPGGQKHLGYQFHTVILLSYDPINKWTMQTPKDREREIMNGKSNKSFTRDYLMSVGKWTMA